MSPQNQAPTSKILDAIYEKLEIHLILIATAFVRQQGVINIFGQGGTNVSTCAPHCVGATVFRFGENDAW